MTRIHNFLAVCFASHECETLPVCGDPLTDLYGSHVSFSLLPCVAKERMADFKLNLMDIDAEQLNIPDTKYSATCALVLPNQSCKAVR